MDDKIWFRNICKRNNCQISERKIELLEDFVYYLLYWNKKINLVSRRYEDNIWTKHILGSISFLFRYKLEPESKIIDVGTGGGLPGIPLAILCPDLQVTVADSIQKKIKAVHSIVSQLRLQNVHPVCGRAENLTTKNEYYQSFDYVIARAVSTIKNVIKWTKPFLNVSSTSSGKISVPQNNYTLRRGTILLLKGGELTHEIEEAKIKIKPHAIYCYPIVVNGIENSAELFDKKLIVVYP